MAAGEDRMDRPPTIDPDKDRERSRLKQLLAGLEAIPPHRRQDEHADERAETVRALLKDLDRLA